MELNEELDKKYLNDKAAFEKVENLREGLQEQVSKLTKEIKMLGRQIEDAETTIKRAVEDKDEEAEEKAAEDKKELEGRKDDAEKALKSLTELLKNNKEKVDKYVVEIENDPELKAHINSIMEKKYNRRLKDVKEEQENLQTLQNAIKEHPSISNNLKGMIRSKEELDKLNSKLEELDSKKDKKEIEEVNEQILKQKDKFLKNKTILKGTFEKNNINLSIDFVEELVNNKKFSHIKMQQKDEKGKTILVDEINLDKTLRNIAKSNKRKEQIYVSAIGKIPGAVIYGQENVKPKLQKEEPEYLEENEGNALIEKEKFSWWRHPIKRFKQWREERKEKNSTEPKKVKLQIPEEKTQASEKFRDAYKYKVVQDYIKDYDKYLKDEATYDLKQNKNKDNER